MQVSTASIRCGAGALARVAARASRYRRECPRSCSRAVIVGFGRNNHENRISRLNCFRCRMLPLDEAFLSPDCSFGCVSQEGMNVT